MFITRPRSAGADGMRAALFESPAASAATSPRSRTLRRADNYFARFNNFVRMMIYFLVPWTTWVTIISCVTLWSSAARDIWMF